MKTLVFALTLVLIGCDKTCEVNGTSTAKINNQTGRSLNLQVCDRGSTKINALTVPGNQDGTMTVSNYKTMDIVGGPGGCSNASDKTLSSGVFLASASFGQVKFCHSNDNASEVTIVETTDSCPQGTTAQAAAYDDCGKI